MDIQASCGQRTDASAILLAGGNSIRMGSDKGMLPFGGTTLLEYQTGRLRQLGISDIMISGRMVETEGARCIMDIYAGCGPLGGLHAGLLASRFRDCLVMGLDTPLVPLETLRDLLDQHLAGEEPITMLTSEGRWEPLLAVYRTDLAGAAERLLKNGRYSLRDLIRESSCRTVPYTGPKEMIINCNTPDEYRCALETASQVHKRQEA